jgi:hypothetical protein
MSMRAFVPFAIAALVAAGSVNCNTEVLVTTGGAGGTGAAGGAGGSGAIGGSPPPGGITDKVDLLLMIDNSRSMADKQEALAATIPDLVEAFVNPRCLGPSGEQSQPDTWDAPCPSGYEREFAPILDMHVGVVTSSLGGVGADACQASMEPTENDLAHLIARSPGGPVATYQSLGFLAWDPTGQLSPPGDANEANLQQGLSAMVTGAGEVGCGYESPLEAWYRFLVEPDPYANVTIHDNSAVLEGSDGDLLSQRAAFLRPDSAVVILMLTDENDCSTQAGGQYFFARQIYQPGTNTPYHLPKPRHACSIDPNDPCCRSCGQGPGDGCDNSQDDCTGSLSGTEDHINLRCWDQKRRFGIDFNYPLDRYVTGLTQTSVTDRYGNVVPNPLFADGQRDATMVYLAGIVGVPWQDIARLGADGTPASTLGFMGPAELANNGRWPIIAGDPATFVAPTDPLMVESSTPRMGQNPITGDFIAPPDSGYLANPINGHEFDNAADELQYACIFPLANAHDCAGNPGNYCDCLDGSNDNPLCQGPMGGFGTTQYQAKAYPALRQLAVIRDVGWQGVVGSICAPQIDDPSAPDWFYRPTFRAMAEAAAKSLAQ